MVPLPCDVIVSISGGLTSGAVLVAVGFVGFVACGVVLIVVVFDVVAVVFDVVAAAVVVVCGIVVVVVDVVGIVCGVILFVIVVLVLGAVVVVVDDTVVVVIVVGVEEIVVVEEEDNGCEIVVEEFNAVVVKLVKSSKELSVLFITVVPFPERSPFVSTPDDEFPAKDQTPI